MRWLIGEWIPQALLHQGVNPLRWRWMRGFSRQEEEWLADQLPATLLHWFIISPVPLFVAVWAGPGTIAIASYVGFFALALWVCGTLTWVATRMRIRRYRLKV